MLAEAKDGFDTLEETFALEWDIELEGECGWDIDVVVGWMAWRGIGWPRMDVLLATSLAKEGGRGEKCNSNDTSSVRSATVGLCTCTHHMRN